MTSSEQIHAFNTLINQLKLIERYKGQVYWKDYPTPRWDSVADHSWRLAMLVVMFAGQLSRPLNTEKAIKMALIHDIPEIIAGDASPLGASGTGEDSYAYNKDVQAVRFKGEETAAKKIFSRLGPDGEELYNLWLEIEALESFEAKVVKALDKIEAMSQVLDWRQGHLFPEHLAFTVKYGSKGAEVDPAIAEYAAHVAGLMKSQYKEFVA